jgi:AcrR family transcriptional regulator
VKNTRRKKIANEAAILFDHHGYHRTTMEDISDVVGIKKPTLYHYFQSKDEILSLIHTEFMDLLSSKQEERKGLVISYEDLLRNSMRDIMRLMVTHRSHVRVFFEHHRELPEPFQSSIRLKRDAYFGLIASYIQIGIDDKKYKISDANLGALAMFGMCNWAYTWFNPNGPHSADDVADQFWKWLTAGFIQGADFEEITTKSASTQQISNRNP